MYFDVSIPYKRVTNFVEQALIDCKGEEFQSPISGSQTRFYAGFYLKERMFQSPISGSQTH